MKRVCIRLNKNEIEQTVCSNRPLKTNFDWMKKHAILIIILFISAFSVTGQNEYYNTVTLMKNIDKGNIVANTEVLTVLHQYFSDINETSEATDIKITLQDNPFLNTFEIKGKAEAEGIGAIKKLGSYKSFSSKIGGLDITTFSQGLSQFMIERAKEELNVAFFQKFKQYFEKNEEFSILFPSTTSIIGNLLAYQYNEMLPTLQEAFISDMEALSENIIQLLLSEKYYNEIKQFPEILLITQTYHVSKLFNDTTIGIPDIIDTLPDYINFGGFDELENYKSVLTVSRIISNAVRDTNTAIGKERYWISSKDFYKNIVSDSVACRIFAGLIYQNISRDKIKFNNYELAKIITVNQSEIFWYQTQFYKFLKITDIINDDYKRVKELKKAGKSISNEDVYGIMSSAINITDFGFNYIKHYDKDWNGDKYIRLAAESNNLYINVTRKEYGMAMNNALNVLDEVVKYKNDKKKKTTSVIDKRVLAGINTYGRFIANVANAETADEVSTAIKSVALPQGSSSIKKYQKNNLCINAYLGGSYNGNKDKNEFSNSWNSNLGLIAPVGLVYTPFSWGNGGSLSLFGSMLDIGAVVDYQLTQDNAEFEQKILLKNILSPGLHIVYGSAWNLPLSLGIGSQYGPGLLSLKQNDAEFSPTWRWNIFLAVDLPILNLVQGQKRKL